MPLTNYLENLRVDHEFRSTAWTQLTTLYFGLILSDRGFWQATTAYSVGETIMPTSGNLNGRMYRCSTSGTSGGTEPIWPTTTGGTVADGTAVWTEMTPSFQAETVFSEVTGGSYARVAITRGDTQFKGTHGTTSGASSGTNGNTTNAVAITFPAPTATWGYCAFWGYWDAATSGNMYRYGALTVPQQVDSGDSAPTFAVDALSITVNTASSIV